MYAKLINSQLVFAKATISGKDETGFYTITNPTEVQLAEKGYKPVVYEEKPEYDFENENIFEVYTDQEDKIVVSYAKTPLDDEEHNEIIQQEINEEENKMTLRNIRNAALGDSYAIVKLQEIENNIAALRAKLRG